ncbi:MAG: hypothetical protein DMF61_26790 [Blastocatellia bacterium AA13]|nr:MAG: hypothetical protein DMF61_26790 [Blastocatellia bacterium AA13]
MDPYELPELLNQFALIPHFDDKIAELANLAEPEDWNYHQALSDRPNPILFNYLRYTYTRIGQEKKVAVTKDEKWACWNTGLVTSHQEPIYVLFEENKFDDRQTYWHFNQFCRKGHYFLNKFSALPEMAHYFDDPAQLVFDSRKELRPNIQHIIADNKERFPEPYRSMNDYSLQTFLKGAIDNAIERVKRNYKTAIPQYYKGSIQLLLPLCIGAADKADLALVVDTYADFYRASTCLTLDMAYNNARQLARPDRDWLQP